MSFVTWSLDLRRCGPIFLSIPFAVHVPVEDLLIALHICCQFQLQLSFDFRSIITILSTALDIACAMFMYSSWAACRSYILYNSLFVSEICKVLKSLKDSQHLCKDYLAQSSHHSAMPAQLLPHLNVHFLCFDNAIIDIQAIWFFERPLCTSEKSTMGSSLVVS